MPRISLVVPAYNEEKLLPRLLDSVDLARARYSGGPAAVEVVVADNASTDATAEIAGSRGCRVARVEKRAIAAARNGGAAIASGEILCFLDADSEIHPDTFDVVRRTLETGRFVGGATGVRFERWSLGLATTFAVMMPVVWATRMDTGVVFCRLDDFRAVGGYDESRLFAEDVVFLLALRRLGKSRGQRLARPRGAKALTSARKFEKHGQWHYLTTGLAVALRSLRSPRVADEFARRYWYEDR